MSTTPKRQDGDGGDGDGSVAANGACSTLEQTLLGVAPAPASGTTPNPTPPVPPVVDAAATEPPSEPACDDAPAPAPPGVAAPASRGFEPVPVPRGHLADSLSGSLGPLADFGGSRRSAPPPLRLDLPFPRAPEAAGRWPLLIAVALSTVAVVWLGGHLLQRYRTANAPQHALAEAAASRALLANRPTLEPGEGRVRVLAATGSGGEHESLGPGASPESQLAATAARHVLSGNYAEALPIYRQLERDSSGNTSYAALARLLEKKVGNRNDTRAVTPAPADVRSAVVLVRAAGATPSWPVKVDGVVVGQTDSLGVAHIHLQARPATTFEISLDTSASGALSPAYPAQRFRIGAADDLYVFDTAFDTPRPGRKAQHEATQSRSATHDGRPRSVD